MQGAIEKTFYIVRLFLLQLHCVTKHDAVVYGKLLWSEIGPLCCRSLQVQGHVYGLVRVSHAAVVNSIAKWYHRARLNPT